MRAMVGAKELQRTIKEYHTIVQPLKLDIDEISRLNRAVMNSCDAIVIRIQNSE